MNAAELNEAMINLPNELLNLKNFVESIFYICSNIVCTLDILATEFTFWCHIFIYISVFIHKFFFRKISCRGILRIFILTGKLFDIDKRILVPSFGYFWIIFRWKFIWFAVGCGICARNWLFWRKRICSVAGLLKFFHLDSLKFDNFWS